jgi:1-acyl-sn-glycerol-3-phosphate acyltransferase
MNATRRLWIGAVDALRAWHRFEVRGLEHLLTDEPMLVVGYHGRPIAHDMILLQNVLHERLGYLPHPIVHGYAGDNKVLKQVIDDLGFVTGDGRDLRAALDAGEHVFVTPGATKEGCRPFTDRYRVNWGRRRGYLKLAIRHGLRIVPVGAHGSDAVYVGLNDGYAWGKRLGMPYGLPAWVGLGIGGLWPLAAPLPVKIRQRVGAPIDLRHVDPADADAMEAAHSQVVGAVQGLLDTARADAHGARRAA